jgi:hypothetical protein
MINKPFPAFMRPVRTSRLYYVSHNPHAAYQRLAAIYLLRLALGLQKKLTRSHLAEFFEDDLGRLSGLEAFYNPGDEDTSWRRPGKPVLVKYLRQQLAQLLEQGVGDTEPLFDNISFLSATLQLNPIEQEILALRLLMPLLEVFRRTIADHCCACTMQSTVDYLRLMTIHPASGIRKALHPAAHCCKWAG